jgi:hypothetical protein
MSWKIFQKSAEEGYIRAINYMRRFDKLGCIPMEDVTRNVFIEGNSCVGKTRLIKALHDNIKHVEYEKMEYSWTKKPRGLKLISRKPPTEGTITPVD